MSDTNSFASLKPTLLARKGGAKPAMRPQVQPLHEFHEATARDMAEDTAEDLGWNDMGQDAPVSPAPPVKGAEVVPIAGDTKAQTVVSDLPAVVRQQASLPDRLEAPGKRRNSALAQGRRAAFTLRLDAERHLKLRLAAAVLNRSAQDIVTEALDNHLATLADIESFAAEIRKRR